MRKANLLVVLIVAGILRTAATAEWLYDGSPILRYGMAVGKGHVTDMVAQKFGFTVPVEITEIGVAIAQESDPNRVGFRAMLVGDPWDLETTTIESWQIYPEAGIELAFAYKSVRPIRLDPNRFYYVVLAPGDLQFAGAVAFSIQGYLGLATNDNGETWFETFPYGLRIGGSVVPEPGGIAVLVVGSLLQVAWWATRRFSP